MNLFAKPESYGYGKRTYGYQRGNVKGRDKSGVPLIGRQGSHPNQYLQVLQVTAAPESQLHSEFLKLSLVDCFFGSPNNSITSLILCNKSPETSQRRFCSLSMNPDQYSIQYIRLWFSHSVVSNFLPTHELQQARHLCPLLSPTVCSNSCPLYQ